MRFKVKIKMEDWEEGSPESEGEETEELFGDSEFEEL